MAKAQHVTTATAVKSVHGTQQAAIKTPDSKSNLQAKVKQRKSRECAYDTLVSMHKPAQNGINTVWCCMLLGRVASLLPSKPCSFWKRDRQAGRQAGRQCCTSPVDI